MYYYLTNKLFPLMQKYSYLYARDVLNSRFELGETTIAEDDYYKKKYFKLTGIRL